MIDMVDRRTDPVLKAMIERRRALGLSQRALARMIGSNQSAISDLECGVFSPTLRMLRRIFVALGLEINLKELGDLDREIQYLRSLKSDQLERELLSRQWYVHSDDLIGGWCVMPVDAPPSCGCFSIADFVSESAARRIAYLHNTSITSQPLDALVMS